MDSHRSMFTRALITQEDSDVRTAPLGVLALAIKAELKLLLDSVL